MVVKEEQHEPCEVVQIGAYDDAQPVMGNFIRVQFPGEEQTRRYSLDKAFEAAGKLPAIGAKVRLVLGSSMKPTGGRGANEGKVFWNEKRKVIGAVAA